MQDQQVPTKEAIVKELEIPDELPAEKVDLLAESEEKPEEKDEEKEDETPIDENVLVTPPRAKEILAKYPNIFKDFPGLKNAYYREREYTELIPTVEEAKELIERAKNYETFESDLLAGNTETTLKSVKESDPQAFAKIVDDYLPALSRTDERAYYHVIKTVLDGFIGGAVQEAKKANNSDLQEAAHLLYQFAFGTSDFKPSGKFAKDEAPKDDKISEERAAFMQERFDTAREDFTTTTTNLLQSTIDTNIDPRGSMSAYVKRNAVKDCLSQLDGALSADPRFGQLMDQLWTKAFDSNFNSGSIKNVRSAYLAKAKALLPSIIAQVRSEALKGASSTNRKQEIEEEETPRRRMSAPQKRETNQDEPRRGKKTLDFLMEN